MDTFIVGPVVWAFDQFVTLQVDKSNAIICLEQFGNMS